MQRIAALVLMFVVSSTVFAAQAHRYEWMFVNCTLQPIVASNGDQLPYRFSMDPLVYAEDGTVPSYTFTIPNQVIYKHPITVYLPWFRSAGEMHVYLTGPFSTEIIASIQEGKYITYKYDPRYVSILGFRVNHDSEVGNRDIIGLGCELPLTNTLNGGKAKLPQLATFTHAVD